MICSIGDSLESTIRQKNMVISIGSMPISGLFMAKIHTRIIIFDSIGIIVNSGAIIMNGRMNRGMMNRCFVNNWGLVNNWGFVMVNGGMMNRGMVNRGMVNRGMVNGGMVNGGMVNRGMMKRSNAMMQAYWSMISRCYGSHSDEN